VVPIPLIDPDRALSNPSSSHDGSFAIRLACYVEPAMAENEAAAHAIVGQLRTIGIDGCVDGAGVHWHVDVGPAASRTLHVHCFCMS
jgi:hypothetical protein